MKEIARNMKLSLLRRAREILSDRDSWGTRRLRQEGPGGKVQYCALGALEQAAYDLGFAEPGEDAFDGSNGIAYNLGSQLSLEAYAERTFRTNVWRVNDGRGYESTLLMFDGYIKEVEEGRTAS